MCKKKLLYAILLIYVAFGTVGANEHTFSVYFDLNKFQLTASDKVNIQHVIDSLSKLNISSIRIIGHTDNSADSLYNINLSNKRAYSVRQFLMSLGFNEKIVQTGFFGEEKPITKNVTREERRLNRRAEIVVTYTGGVSAKLDVGCQGKDTVLRTRAGKEIVINKCEYEEVKHCLEIKEQKTYYELKKGIVIMNKGGQDLSTFGLLQVDLLDGCVKNECFKTPLKIRFPLKVAPLPDNHSWALVKGEKMPLKLVTVNAKLFYELELKCPTSWINCNCKKSQKH